MKARFLEAKKYLGLIRLTDHARTAGFGLEARLTYSYLVFHLRTSRYAKDCHPQTIADYTGLDVRTVRTTLLALAEVELARVNPKGFWLPLQPGEATKGWFERHAHKVWTEMFEYTNVYFPCPDAPIDLRQTVLYYTLWTLIKKGETSPVVASTSVNGLRTFASQSWETINDNLHVLQSLGLIEIGRDEDKSSFAVWLNDIAPDQEGWFLDRSARSSERDWRERFPNLAAKVSPADLNVLADAGVIIPAVDEANLADSNDLTTSQSLDTIIHDMTDEDSKTEEPQHVFASHRPDHPRLPDSASASGGQARQLENPVSADRRGSLPGNPGCPRLPKDKANPRWRRVLRERDIPDQYSTLIQRCIDEGKLNDDTLTVMADFVQSLDKSEVKPYIKQVLTKLLMKPDESQAL